jgi:hypothetical protein
MSVYYGMYVDSFESQEAWLYCVIFVTYTALLDQLLLNKVSKSVKHLNSTITHCIARWLVSATRVTQQSGSVIMGTKTGGSARIFSCAQMTPDMPHPRLQCHPS